MRELNLSSPPLALVAILIDNALLKAYVVGSISLPKYFLTASPIAFTLLSSALSASYLFLRYSVKRVPAQPSRLE